MNHWPKTKLYPCGMERLRRSELYAFKERIAMLTPFGGRDIRFLSACLVLDREKEDHLLAQTSTGGG